MINQQWALQDTGFMNVKGASGKPNVVVAVIDGELTVKRIKKRGGRIFLLPENPDFPVMEILGGMNFEVWGVVTYVIHSL